MKKKYAERVFRTRITALADEVNIILGSAQQLGHKMSVRQLYYQLVLGGHIENSSRAYTSLTAALNDLRIAGVVDWDVLVDNDSPPPKPFDWQGHERRRRDDQPYDPVRAEVWIAKPTVAKAVMHLEKELCVRIVGHRGFPSQLFMRAAGEVLAHDIAMVGRPQHILHFADYDAQRDGILHDVESRLLLFSGQAGKKRPLVTVTRVGLCRRHIARMPKAPDKDCHELEVIGVPALVILIRDAVESVRAASVASTTEA